MSVLNISFKRSFEEGDHIVFILSILNMNVDVARLGLISQSYHTELYMMFFL